MNIRNNDAGYVTDEHIKKSGFFVFDTIEESDMGQSSYSMPQWTNGKIKILGGYWNYIIEDAFTGQKLWDGWWNSNEEFDKTIAEINNSK